MKPILLSGVIAMILGGAILASTVLASTSSQQTSGHASYAGEQPSNFPDKGAQLQSEISQLRHQLTGSEPQLRVVDNGCVYLPEDASSNPALGPHDPRLQPCPHGIEYVAAGWSAQPTTVQMAIYGRELELLPLDVTLDQAQRQMEAVLTPLS